MLSAAHIKQVKALKERNIRRERYQFVVEGEKMFHELIQSSFEAEAVYALEQWAGSLSSEIRQSLGNKLILISEKELERISSLKQPNKVLAVVNMPRLQVSEITFNDVILAFEDISDPGNLGSIIRIADWFGIRQIVCSTHSVDCYNPKTIQATMGSVFRVKVFYTDLKEWIQQHQSQATFYATHLSGKSVYTVSKKIPAVLLFGNESRGVSDELNNLIQNTVSIPSFHQADENSAESLNIAMSAAIFCNEWRRP